MFVLKSPRHKFTFQHLIQFGGLAFVAVLISACDSSQAAATVTARVAGTNAINLTLSVVPSATAAPISTSVATSATAGAGSTASASTAMPTVASTNAVSVPATMVPTGAATSATSASTPMATVVPITPATAAPTSVPTSASTTAATAAVSSAGGTTAVRDTSWLKDAVIYSVFVRSFRDGNGDGIGDLKGVLNGLDYIQSMGVNTIWLLPIFKSPSYHGYDISDYNAISPDYGTTADLIKLDEAVHQRHMHILLDYVVNHTSDQHPYFKDALGNPKSQYASFYNWQNPEHTKYDSFAGVTSIPTLNYDTPAVRQFAIDIALHWMDPLGNGDLTAGVDGYRCDVATGPPHDFWAQLRTAMTAKNPHSILLGEIWLGQQPQIAPYLKGDQFDAAFDFPLYNALAGSNTDQNGGGALAGKLPNFAALMLRVGQKLYPPNATIVRMINNHDTNRIMSAVNGDMNRARAAAVFELTVPGVPDIYYGEELGMKGEKGGPPWYDAYRREPLPWFASLQGSGQTTWFKPTDKNYNQPNSGISVEEEDNKPDSLLTLYRILGQLRAAQPALRAGTYDLPTLTGSASNLYELRAWDGKSLFVIVINFSTTSADWPIGSAFTVNSQSYTPAAQPTLMQGATLNAGTWSIAPAGYVILHGGA